MVILHHVISLFHAELFIERDGILVRDQIDGDMRSSNRVGSFIVESASLDELNERVKYCMDSVGIIDDKGNNMILQPKVS